MSDEISSTDSEETTVFDPKEMDKIIRQIVDKVRGQYFVNEETARGIPGEVKKIIDHNIDRM